MTEEIEPGINYWRVPTTKRETRKSIQKFLEGYSSKLKTLDVGCGKRWYASLFPNSVGFDIKPGRYVQIVGDVHKMPFKDGEFNIVLATEVLEHCKDPLTALKEMNRVLKDKGRLLLTTRFVFPYHDPPDYFRFTKDGLHHLLVEAGFIPSILPERCFSDIFKRYKMRFYPFAWILKRFNHVLPVTGYHVSGIKYKEVKK